MHREEQWCVARRPAQCLPLVLVGRAWWLGCPSTLPRCQRWVSMRSLSSVADSGLIAGGKTYGNNGSTMELSTWEAYDAASCGPRFGAPEACGSARWLGIFAMSGLGRGGGQVSVLHVCFFNLSKIIAFLFIHPFTSRIPTLRCRHGLDRWSRAWDVEILDSGRNLSEERG